MHTTNRLIVTALMLVGCYTTNAQKTRCGLTIEGKISVNDTVGISYNALSVTILQTGAGVFADSDGNYIFKNICPGKYTVEIKYVGYKTVDTAMRVSHNTVINIELLSTVNQLAGVTVTEQAIHKDQLATTVKTTLAGRELEETRGNSLGESLKSITGVNSIQTGPSISKPVIHGVYSNRILILNNGVRQEGQNWGNDHAPEIDPFIATKLSVIKGAESIRYGSDAVGGVILVEPKDLPSQPGTDGEVNLVGMTNGRIGVASAMLEGALGDKLEGLSWRVQGTVKKAGNAQAAHYYMGNTGFDENDYSATLGYKKKNYGAEVYFSQFDSKIGIAAASHIGTLQDLYSAFNRTAPAVKADFTYDIGRPYQTVNHSLLKTSAFVNFKDMGRLEATYAFQQDTRKEYDADISFNDSLARLNPPDLYFKLRTSTFDLVWQHPNIAKRILGSLGVNFITHGNLQQGTGYQELIPNFVDYGGGIFAIEKYTTGKLTLEGGARYDYKWMQAYTVDSRTLTEKKPTYNWHNTSLNAGAVYKFTNQFSATYNFGTAWRPPQVIELFANGIHQSAASYEHGDTSLTLEKAYNNNLTFSWHANNNFEAEVGFYVNYFHHYIYLKPDSLPVETIQGAFPSYTYTQVNALFKGVDVNLSYHFLNHFTIISKTTIIRARNLTIHDWLVGVPADRFDNTIRYEWSPANKQKKFYLGINNLVVSRQTRVPPKSDYVPPPAGYMLWGADAGCELPFYGRMIDMNVTVSNLANVAYRDYLNRFRYFLDDLGRNISLRLKIPLVISGDKRGNAALN